MYVKPLIPTGLLLLGVWMTGEAGFTQLSPSIRSYTLTKGSELVDDCPICGRPTILVPMTGSFALRFVDQNPVLTRYELLNISFHAGAAPGREYQVHGAGTYQVGGEVAVTQEVFLGVEID